MLETQSRWHQGAMPWERHPNKLLAKSELGRTRPITIDIPEDRHYYGKQIPHDQYKAREVIYDWQTHTPSESHGPPAKNMLNANRSCVAKGLHTSGDFYRFRQTHSSIIPRKLLGSKEIKLKLPEEGFSYGRQTRPSDAMRTVIGNGYSLYESQRLEQVYNTRSEFGSNAPKKLSAHLTRSYKLMKDTAQRKLQALNWRKLPQKTFKLSKFSNVPHKIDNDRGRPKTSAGVSSQAKQTENQEQQQQIPKIQQNR